MLSTQIIIGYNIHSPQSPTEQQQQEGGGGLATPTSLEGVVLRLLQTVLGYSLSLSKTRGNAPSQETKYWQGLITKTYSITDKVATQFGYLSSKIILTHNS